MMDESIKMKRFDHPNVISLIGVCIDAGPAPYIIMPFMGKGSLLSYLKKHRTELMPSDTADEDVVNCVHLQCVFVCVATFLEPILLFINCRWGVGYIFFTNIPASFLYWGYIDTQYISAMFI